MNADQIKDGINSLTKIIGALVAVSSLIGLSPAAVEKITQTAALLGTNSEVIGTAVGTLMALGAAVWSYWKKSTVQQVESVAALPAGDQREALNKVSDSAKVKIAENVPDVAKVVIKDDATGKLGALAASESQPGIVTESQNATEVVAGVAP